MITTNDNFYILIHTPHGMEELFTRRFERIPYDLEKEFNLSQFQKEYDLWFIHFVNIEISNKYKKEKEIHGDKLWWVLEPSDIKIKTVKII